MVHPAGQQIFLTTELTFSLIYFGQSPLRIQFKSGICLEKFSAESAIQLFPSRFCRSSSSACRLATSSAKDVNDSFYLLFQIQKFRTFKFQELLPQADDELSLPNSISTRSPSMGMTALKQSTKEAQIKGMKQVKQEICCLVLGVTSPQPMVVAVTISLQKIMQSSGIVPSGSLSVHSLYPSSTSPRNKYQTSVYLSRLTKILSSLVILFCVEANRSSMTSPKEFDTYAILKKNRPTRKLQLLGIRLQAKKREITTCRTSRKCFLDINNEIVVNPNYKSTVCRESLELWLHMLMQR